MWTLSPAELSIVLLSLKVAAWCVVILLLPAMAMAWLLAKKRFWGQSLLDALVHLPMVLPPVVLGYMLLVLLGRRGWIGAWLYEQFHIQFTFHWWGAVIASAVMAFPLMVRSIRQALLQVNPLLEQAAQTLGASPIRVFLTITLPLSYHGLLTGSILAFSRSLGEFGATITFAGNLEGETRTLPLAIYSLTQTPEGDAAALRLVILSVLVSIFALLASQWLERRLIRSQR
ncbi:MULTISPECIES: molybdate ABC transporter permease subunit [unclassified Methylophilus]|jgi:molybdate transport system permease protein|uniref:molybdate ABC transporter permease subunit n=1 Tax=unclassified Methylophilus TaxID=2630143 RepID=UPI0006FB12B3|nr:MULTISPECIES: molybdate ABC transporter permease subunit [unclassified Methylophilus]KQT36361.1 molybdenum ABC transporter permease [Methylophilus sp. Leaf414]KQT42134.1 molybdenum ABC transporter permease [Methylophilus sp. Leaf416]KQT56315.1 molybdenum ABC transporter permease [Methylophilus sp. Leaf459]